MMFEVVIPFRDLGNDLRAENLAFVIEHLEDAGATVYVDDGCPFDWSPGRARNLGFAGTCGDIVVFNDADTIVPATQIHLAVALAELMPGLVYAYDLYVRRDKEGRDRDVLYNTPSVGCVAVSRECFQTAGGFCEEYEGWGYEDVEFAQRCSKLWPVRRVAGPAYHLWHGDRNPDDSPTDSDPDQVERNLKLWKLSLATSTA